jgi:macrolide-specific efflux system membrane fusion protein
MRLKKIIIILSIFILLAVVVFLKFKNAKPDQVVIKEIIPVMGSIQKIVSTTGTVLPKNRLELKPPVNGRIESVEVKEGDEVKIGQTLAWMSSTERAALLDAARGQGEEALKYWQDVYKAIPLISPIKGEVIVATTQPGQTVTTSDAVIVLSDHLIVRAQVDETDIGKIKIGQKAILSLDAYPETKIPSSVEHIYYESETVNNVTIYKADLLPENVSPFFRSGMNVSIDFIESSKEKALLIPQEAVLKDKEEYYVFVKQANGESRKQIVQLGMSDDKNVEVVLGLNKDDVIVLKTKKYNIPKSSAGVNPFLPNRRK